MISLDDEKHRFLGNRELPVQKIEPDSDNTRGIDSMHITTLS